MTITTPSTVQITSDHGLWLPDMAQEPLLTALKNVNYLMQYHRPPLVSACYTADPVQTRTSVYVIPITPSADSLRYDFIHRIVCSAVSQSITITVDETSSYTGASTTWSNIYTQGITSDGTGGNLTTSTQSSQPIASTSEALRIQYSAPSSGTRTDHHVLVHPAPAAPSAGIQSGSNAVPFDDGLLADADLAPVHTEWINRCKRTAVAVLTDRKQCALSFVQDESSPRYSWSTLGTEHYGLPAVRVYLPHQGPNLTLSVSVIGKVSAGSTTDMIRVRQIGVGAEAKSVLLDASDAVETGSLAVKLQGVGLMRYCDLEVGVRHTGSNTTELRAVMAYYTPGD